MNGWFPRIGSTQIASGNAGIWTTPIVGGASVQVDVVGIGPIWAGDTLVYNRNNNTTQVGATVLPVAYLDYRGSTGVRWAGVAAGVTYLYDLETLLRTIPNAYAPRFWTFGGGQHMGWITPDHTQLVIDDTVVVNGGPAILDWVVPPDGGFSAYQISTGQYTRGLVLTGGPRCEIRPDEAPIAAFNQGGLGWLVTGTGLPGGVTFVRPAQSSIGYAVIGILNFSDAAMQPDGRLLLVGSDDAGNLRQIWIAFTEPRRDLSQMNGTTPPDGGGGGSTPPDGGGPPPNGGGPPQTEPPILAGDTMIDPKTVILYKAQKKSSRDGCVNLILHDDSVFSCQADGSPGTRPAGTDGPWEQAQVTGSLATFHSFEQNFYAFGIAPIDKVL